MEFLLQLWMPILASAAIAFVASSILWMATPLHKHDYKNPGDKEGPIADAFRSMKLAPGAYFIPWCQGKDMKDPAVREKFKAGPWVLAYVLPGAPNMGKMLGLWFVHLALVGTATAYIAWHGLETGLEPGAPYLSVFRVAGAASLMAHAGYALPMAIWHGMPWRQVPGRLIDGVIYASLTAGVFAWLWPNS